MVLQQCLACNTAMTDSCISCVCGHVFEYSKKIGGKRFSEYRAKLYTRLEDKRVKKLKREQRKAETKVKYADTPVENKTNKKRKCEDLPKTRTHSARSTTINRRKKSKRYSRLTDPSLRRVVLPPELVSRLPSALQEINRRLTGQNMMWWTMHLLQQTQ